MRASRRIAQWAARWRRTRDVHAETLPPICHDVKNWAAKTSGAGYEVIDPASTVSRLPPTTLDPRPSAEFTPLLSYDAPGRLLVKIPGARLAGGSGLVRLPSGAYVGELLAVTPEGQRTALADELRHNPRPLAKPQKFDGRFYAALGIGVANYHHFTHDIAVKLSRVIDHLPSDTRIIVPAPLAPFQHSVLSLVSDEPDRWLPMPSDAAWELEELYVATPIAKTLTTTPEHYQPFLAAAARHLGISHGAPTRRIFVSRRGDSYRRPLNEAEVEAALSRYGFETIEPARLSLAQQASIFAEAEVVVGTGSGLSNMLYMQPGTKVVEFYERSLTHTTFWCLAATLGLDYCYFRCDEVGDPGRTPDLQVPIATLVASVELMIGANRG